MLGGTAMREATGRKRGSAMSNRDPDASIKTPAPPEGREEPGAPPRAGVADRAAAEPPRLVQRISAEEMASWVRLEHISWETAERLIAAARQDFVRPSRAEPGARGARQDPETPLAAGNEIPKGVAPPRGDAQSAPKKTKK
jgi:hypothetical protein